MLYHVSEKPGLKVLRPHVSSHGRAYVYAVDDLVTGLLFGAGHDDFDLYLSNDAAGVPTVRECWPGAFQKVYQGKRCSVYEVDEAGFQRGVTSWDPELVENPYASTQAQDGFRPSSPEIIEPAAKKVHMISQKIEAPEDSPAQPEQAPQAPEDGTSAPPAEDTPPAEAPEAKKDDPQ